MRRVLALTATAAVTFGAVVALPPDGRGPADTGPPRDGQEAVVAAAAGLEVFDACDTLVDHLRAVGTSQPWHDLAVTATLEESEAAMDAAGGEADGAARASEVTGTSDTNVQVAGVDEPDLVETDGRRLFTVGEGRLHVVDVSGDVPASLAAVPLDVGDGAEGELLLHEDRLLVVLRGWGDPEAVVAPRDGEMVDMIMPAGTPRTTLLLYDVAADEPTEVARAEVEGELVAGRGVDGTAHLVVAHRPDPIPVDLMHDVWAATSAEQASRRMQAALADTTATDWLPVMRHVDARGAVTTAPAVDCRDVVRPVAAQDTSMLQVLTIDTHGGDVVPEATTAVLTDARTVTASATELVVATPTWDEPDGPVGGPAVDAPEIDRAAAPEVTTHLHLFDLGPEGTTHRASGEVPGELLNQFSMSLHDGTLRVATTVGDPWAGTSESGVTVLRRATDRLEVIGSVGGLGRGETIHAVRFLGDRAYVVTFRQTDPLYTVDLSDPTAPAVTGELKITGYSAYLHPLGDDRLLGVGQEATLEGQVTGTQVSVFDVADPAAPTRVSQVMLPGATSEAEWDHHAVLVHDGLVVLPYERWTAPTPDRPEGFEAAAMVLQVDGDRVGLRGTIASSDAAGRVDPWRGAVRRAVVVDGRLVTVSRAEVVVHDPVSLETLGTLSL